MLKYIYIIIIIYIILKHLIDDLFINKSLLPDNNIKLLLDNNIKLLPDNNIKLPVLKDYNNETTKLHTTILERHNLDKNEQKVIINENPNPWTKVIFSNNDYLYHIKIKIPSLNDFENWKNIIPNINFDPVSGELIIPSKDEQSALAIANLILINFSGKLTIQDIIKKNLIQISISKAKAHKLVQNKIREQIMEELYGKQINKPVANYQKDFAIKKKELPIENNKNLDFKSNTFSDTFEHFNDLKTNDSSIEGWDNGNFSYL